MGGGGGGGGVGRMTSEQIFFCCYNRSVKKFSGHGPVQIFFIVFFRKGEGEGVLKLGLYVLHHNNNFNLIKLLQQHIKNYVSIYGVNKTSFGFRSIFCSSKVFPLT